MGNRKYRTRLSAKTNRICKARLKLYDHKQKKIAQNFVVTNGSENSTIFENNRFYDLDAYKVEAVDSNGAGDIFAGATLFKVIEHESFLEACKFGNFASSIIVQEKSPRLTKNGYKNLIHHYRSSL